MTLKRSRSVTCEVSIKAPVDAVWRALTEADELTRWFPMRARTKPGKGGAIFLAWDGAWEGEGKIEVWEPNRHLRMTWPWGGAGESKGASPIAVDYYLEAKGGETVLRLVHSGFGMGAEWDNEYDGVSGGWNYELRSLRHYLERHAGRNRRCVQAMRRVRLSHEGVWGALIGPGGVGITPPLGELREGGKCAVRMPWGETFEGVAEIAEAGRQFSAALTNLNDALFRIEVFPAPPEDPAGGSPERLRASEGNKSPMRMEAWLWFSLWGVEEGRAAELERNARAALEGMLPR